MRAKELLKLCGQDSYSEGSPQSIRLWFPGPRGSPPRVSRGDLVLVLLLQTLLFLCSAGAAKPSNFQAHYLNLELIRCGDFLFQSLERGSRKFENLTAFKAGKMQMVFLGLDLVVVLLAVRGASDRARRSCPAS